MEKETEKRPEVEETEKLQSPNPSNEEDKSHSSANGNEDVGEGVPPDEMVHSEDEENSPESRKATEEAAMVEEEEAADSPPGAVDSITVSQDLDEKTVEVKEDPASREQSVLFEMNSEDHDGLPRLPLGSPERENTSPDVLPDKEGDEPAAADKNGEDAVHEEQVKQLGDLLEERDRAVQDNIRLQGRLAEYFSKRPLAADDSLLRPEGGTQQSERLHSEYEKKIRALTQLQQHVCTESHRVQQLEEEQKTQAQEKLDKVDSEWRALAAQKRDVLVTWLSGCRGNQAAGGAQDRVASCLEAERRGWDRLTALRLAHLHLRTRVSRLQAELRDGLGQDRDPLQVLFDKLQADQMESRRRAEKHNEEALRIERKISSSLELVSNVKEKLSWSQSEVRVKRDELAELERAVAGRRELLFRTKQARNALQRDNRRLREQRGMLGNRVLLRDMEHTLDATEHLEGKLESLKGRQAELTHSCGRGRKMQERVKLG